MTGQDDWNYYKRELYIDINLLLEHLNKDDEALQSQREFSVLDSNHADFVAPDLIVFLTPINTLNTNTQHYHVNTFYHT